MCTNFKFGYWTLKQNFKKRKSILDPLVLNVVIGTQEKKLKHMQCKGAMVAILILKFKIFYSMRKFSLLLMV